LAWSQRQFASIVIAASSWQQLSFEHLYICIAGWFSCCSLRGSCKNSFSYRHRAVCNDAFETIEILKFMYCNEASTIAASS